MMHAAFFALCAALALAGCGEAARNSGSAEPEPSPALWEIHNDAGLEGWLFGTIHALPSETKWRTDTFERAFESSDLLVLEITEYDDAFLRDEVMWRLAVTEGLPLPSARLQAEDRPSLRLAFEESGLDERDYRDVESWAVALSLSSALSSSDPGSGVDRTLYDDALGRSRYSILALEGTQAQLSIFDRLPQAAQLALLEGVSNEGRSAEKASARVESWRSGDLNGLQAQLTTGYMADPVLLAALLDDRNRDWLPKIAAMLDGDAKPFIAVGAGHLLGDTALQILLTREGYTLRRVQ